MTTVELKNILMHKIAGIEDRSLLLLKLLLKRRPNPQFTKQLLNNVKGLRKVELKLLKENILLMIKLKWRLING